MITSLKRLLSPFLSLAFLMLANGYFATYTSLRLKIDGVDVNLIGFISSAYYVGFLLGSSRVERLISRIKHIRAFAVLAALLAAMLMLQGLFINPYAWIPIRFVIGAAIAALYVVIESWFLVVSPEKLRGRILALYMVALYSAQSLSQFLIDAVDLMSLEPFLLAGLLQILSILPVALTKTSIPDLVNPQPKTLLTIFKHSPFGVTGCFVSGMLLAAIYSLMPIFAYESAFSVSLLMFLIIAGGFVFQWPLGTLSDLFDRRKVLFLTNLATLIPCLFICLYFNDETVVRVASFFLGGVLFAIYPISMAQVCDRLRSEHVTAVTGVLVLAYGAGAIFGPLIAPIFMEAFPGIGLFLFLGAVSLAFAAVGVLSFIFLPPIPQEKQGPHSLATPTSPLLESVAEGDSGGRAGEGGA